MQSINPIKPRLLVLDEDRIILQSLSQFLSREGYDVKTVDNSADAISRLESGQFELLIADINIPGVKPADFLRDVRRRLLRLAPFGLKNSTAYAGAPASGIPGAHEQISVPGCQPVPRTAHR